MSENAGWGRSGRAEAGCGEPGADGGGADRQDARTTLATTARLERIPPFPEVVAYDERARSLTQRVVTLNRRPIEAALGVTTRLAAGGVFEVLRRDSDYLAQAMTRNQALELGIADP